MGKWEEVAEDYGQGEVFALLVSVVTAAVEGMIGARWWVVAAMPFLAFAVTVAAYLLLSSVPTLGPNKTRAAFRVGCVVVVVFFVAWAGHFREARVSANQERGSDSLRIEVLKADTTAQGLRVSILQARVTELEGENSTLATTLGAANDSTARARRKLINQAVVLSDQGEALQNRCRNLNNPGDRSLDSDVLDWRKKVFALLHQVNLAFKTDRFDDEPFRWDDPITQGTLYPARAWEVSHDLKALNVFLLDAQPDSH